MELSEHNGNKLQHSETITTQQKQVMTQWKQVTTQQNTPTQQKLFIYCYFIYLFFFNPSFYYLCFFGSVTVILLHCGSFCHKNKFLVCVNIPGNKADSDSSDSETSRKIETSHNTTETSRNTMVTSCITQLNNHNITERRNTTKTSYDTTKFSTQHKHVTTQRYKLQHN